MDTEASEALQKVVTINMSYVSFTGKGNETNRWLLNSDFSSCDKRHTE